MLKEDNKGYALIINAICELDEIYDTFKGNKWRR
jgi:hypothetical protein